MRVKLILPALTEARSPFFRPIVNIGWQKSAPTIGSLPPAARSYANAKSPVPVQRSKIGPAPASGGTRPTVFLRQRLSIDIDNRWFSKS